MRMCTKNDSLDTNFNDSVQNSLREFTVYTWKTHCVLKFHFGQIAQCEICIEVSFS